MVWDPITYANDDPMKWEFDTGMLYRNISKQKSKHMDGAMVQRQETTYLLLLLLSQEFKFVFETWMPRRWFSRHSNVTMLKFCCVERFEARLVPLRTFNSRLGIALRKERRLIPNC